MEAQKRPHLSLFDGQSEPRFDAGRDGGKGHEDGGGQYPPSKRSQSVEPEDEREQIEGERSRGQRNREVNQNRMHRRRQLDEPYRLAEPGDGRAASGGMVIAVSVAGRRPTADQTAYCCASAA